MTLPSTATTYSVTVPGARLHYEARGTGPLVLVIGSPMVSADFAPLADALAGDHTVVTYDPRGHAASTIEDLQEESTPESRADDIAAILDDLGAESADVFGSSGGAVTGLALVVRHPGRVRTLVAHEPPLLELLPDAARHRANTEAIIETFHADGLQAAWYQFMVMAGFDMSGPGEGRPGRGPARADRTGDSRGRPVLRPRTATDDPVPPRHRHAEQRPVARGDRRRRRLPPAAHLRDVRCPVRTARQHTSGVPW